MLVIGGGNPGDISSVGEHFDGGPSQALVKTATPVPALGRAGAVEEACHHPDLNPIPDDHAQTQEALRHLVTAQ